MIIMCDPCEEFSEQIAKEITEDRVITNRYLLAMFVIKESRRYLSHFMNTWLRNCGRDIIVLQSKLIWPCSARWETLLYRPHS